jgi:acetyltransferase-like isoleucine patch superfamily enzyme
MNDLQFNAKKMLHFISAVFVSPITLSYKLIESIRPSDSLFTSYSQFLSLIPGKTGSYLRTAFYRFSMTRCTADCVISFLVVFAQRDTEIEAGVYLGPGCNIGSCKVARNTLVGSGVHIMSGKKQHQFTDLAIPIKEQQGFFEKIVIGQDCWIGNAALIMANIGEKSIVGAGSVVTHDVPPYSIVAGNPARVIGNRASVKDSDTAKEPAIINLPSE